MGEEQVKIMCANHLALVAMLADKGIITMDEYERCRLQAVHEVDQEWQRRKDEALKELSPAERLLVELGI